MLSVYRAARFLVFVLQHLHLERAILLSMMLLHSIRNLN